MSTTAPLRRALAGAVCLLAAATPSLVWADGTSVEFLAEKLKSDDARVRANAALALGASNDDRAVKSLCSALGDDSELVRNSSVAALKKLGRASATECLTARKSVESSAAVKTQIDAALVVLKGGAVNPSAKYYVAVAPVSDKSGRGDVDAVVTEAIREKLGSLGAYQMAPAKENAAAAKAVLAKRNLKGFYLTVSVDPFDYTNGTKAAVKVAIFTYPNKDLRGEAPGRARSSAAKGDKSSEDAVLKAAIEAALDSFNKHVDQF